MNDIVQNHKSEVNQSINLWETKRAITLFILHTFLGGTKNTYCCAGTLIKTN